MKKKEVTLADVYQKQQEENRQQTKPKQSTLNTKTILIWSIGMVLVIVVASSIFLFTKDDSDQQLTMVQAPRPFLPAQKEIKLSKTSIEDLLLQFEKSLIQTYTPGDLAYITIKDGEDYLTTVEFLSFLKSSAPTLITTFLEDDFLLGVLSTDKNYPILIFEIKENEYNNIFSGMLRWEKDLTTDLGFIAKKTPFSTANIFVDRIIKNQNVRVLEKATPGGVKETLLLYTIFNKKHLIITEDQQSLEEIINRFVLYKFS
ncbi:hypothetical protein ACFLZC_01285 [Patescibacteria group bacterium]